MNSVVRERNCIFNELDMVARMANEMRLLLAKDDLDVGDRIRTETALKLQRRELTKLCKLLAQIDVAVTAALQNHSAPDLDRGQGHSQFSGA